MITVQEFIKESGVRLYNSMPISNPLGITRPCWPKEYTPMVAVVERKGRRMDTLCYVLDETVLQGEKGLSNAIWNMAYDLQSTVNKSYSKWLRQNGFLFCEENRLIYENISRMHTKAKTVFEEYYPHLLETDIERYEREWNDKRTISV